MKKSSINAVTQMRDLADYLARSAEAQGGDAGHIRTMRMILGALNTELNGGSTRAHGNK